MAQKSFLMQTYGRLPVAFERGEGVWLWDTDGNKYLDALAGVAVCSLGHAHPALTKAICDQAGQLLHTSNWYRIPVQETLAERLCAVSAMERVFFSNSGAEANEAAIKLARLYGHNKGIDVPTIIVTDQSFHGRTMATLTATGSRKAQAGFEPLVQGFARVPYDDLDAIRQVASNNSDVVAVMVEPILGEGGVVIPRDGFLKSLREICDENGWLLILDEIQTGLCRTGKWFAAQHENVVPDVMTLAKALGNGMPIGACLARGDAAETLVAGKHGSTYGGNPLACTAALAVIETLQAEKFDQVASQTGQYLLEKLQNGLAGMEGVREIRGKGLMIGIELDRDCGELMGAALDKGLLINVTAGNVLRLLPPLILSQPQCDQLAAGVTELLNDFLAVS
ncbi:MAG: aspartate aminotransferase family protein [Acidiferrobacterales bacterium]